MYFTANSAFSGKVVETNVVSVECGVKVWKNKKMQLSMRGCVLLGSDEEPQT